MSELKNVVIVGASAAGAQVAHQLEKTLPSTHRIVLIEANNFAYWPIGALRASVKAGFENEIFASYDNFFPADSRHIILTGYKVASISAQSVKLDKQAPAPFNSDEIQVDIGVIATGSKYAYPMRPSSQSLEESVESLRKLQKDIEQAKNVVILGAGPVGIEMSGEIRAVYPDKKITIIERGPRILNGFREALHNNLLNQLKKKKIEIKFNTSVEVTDDLQSSAQKLLNEPLKLSLSDGSTIETDFLFIGTGGSPNVSAVPQEALSEATAGVKGSRAPVKRVGVDQGTLRVQYEPLKERWFCLGDASNSNDSKTNIAATAHAPIVASQVVGQAGNTKKGVKQHTKALNAISVPLGPDGGATQVIWPVFGEWVTSLGKGKGLLLNLFTPIYPGGQPLKK
ncbi:FAD/NAD(P)-binding domain-containing protein [Meira miltonrushii]|uniref:FAD/NAD(P)-binding domain-containing protein n=1 Tax=Meira miltonrushii TaxID=1280837 RepID=A0A316V9X9_9BASI|nr:FAD/NAD(P)-binding domain-containing protein [Meira miltonrushii]PWN34272.1 FAD/NAD(P)-binding domain-containing protein [Meira miltonrushii]